MKFDSNINSGQIRLLIRNYWFLLLEYISNPIFYLMIFNFIIESKKQKKKITNITGRYNIYCIYRIFTLGKLVYRYFIISFHFYTYLDEQPSELHIYQNLLSLTSCFRPLFVVVVTIPIYTDWYSILKILLVSIQ